MRTLLPLLLLGCPGKTPTDTSEPVTPVPIDPIPGTDQGSLALVRGYQNGLLVRSELVGVFANDLQEFVNVAHCLPDETTPCLHVLPPLGESRQYDPLERYVENRSFYRYVGLTVPFGPYETYYRADELLSWYYADLSGRGDFSGPADITLGVEWGDVDLPAAVDVPKGLVVTSPRQDETLRAFSDEDAFTILWEPEGADEMYLFLRTDDETSPGRVWRIEDDGSHDLDLNALNLPIATVLDIQLARWSHDTFDIEGNTLDVLTTAEADFVVEYVPVGLRAPIEVGNDCASAVSLPVGGHYGDLAGMADTFEVVECLQSQEPSAGLDAVYNVTIPPHHRMEIDFRQFEANGAVYILESCDELEPVCEEGADRGFGTQTEMLTRFNPDPLQAEVVTLVVDGVTPTYGGLFFLDHRSIELPDPPLSDTCAGALDAPLFQPGEYYSGNPSDLNPTTNPGFLGCTQSTLPGADGTLRLEVPDGATLEVTMSMEDGDPALYLTSDCADLDSCLTGSDNAGAIETLVHVNNTGDVETLYLTLDTKDTLSPFFLTINIL
ncbi:MAG: hypothetical protein H6734_21190 [Alphaproteobacteria bacterium]|nr:hypothetical protein [Alphaproteobacteria bacterium]